MKGKLSILILIAISAIQALYALGFERMFPEITSNVKEINSGAFTDIGEYGYFFVTPDSGLVYYDIYGNLKSFSTPLPIVSATCLGDSYVTDKIFCATGLGSESDALYEFNTTTQQFAMQSYTGEPNFIKYLSSGFYFGSVWGLSYSTNGSSWSEISYFNINDVKGIEVTEGGILFASVKRWLVDNAILVMKNGNIYIEFDTGFPDLNDIYVIPYPSNEVVITLGSGTYSDGLYKVLYNDSTVTGLELIAYIPEANLITEYKNYYIVTTKNSTEIYAVPFSGGESFQLQHDLDITKINCISEQYPIYTENFLIGTDKGVYMILGSVGIEDTSVPLSTELHQNYPNPFNPETSIKYSLSNDAQVKLTVYDITGREVARLVSEKQARGNYDVKFNGGNMTSGLYFYRLDVDGKTVQSRKMMLLK